MNNEQTKFEGFACVELMGHGFEAGYVQTVYFGGPAMFRIDTPNLPASPEIELPHAGWLDGVFCGPGTKYNRAEIPGRTCFVGVTTIFRMTPCDEATARAALERRIERPIKILSLVDPPKQLAGRYDDAIDEHDDDE